VLATIGTFQLLMTIFFPRGGAGTAGEAAPLLDFLPPHSCLLQLLEWRRTSLSGGMACDLKHWKAKGKSTSTSTVA